MDRNCSLFGSRPTCLTRNTWSVRARLMEIYLSFSAPNQSFHNVKIFLRRHALSSGGNVEKTHQKHEFFIAVVRKLMLHRLSFNVCIGNEQHFC